MQPLITRSRLGWAMTKPVAASYEKFPSTATVGRTGICCQKLHLGYGPTKEGCWYDDVSGSQPFLSPATQPWCRGHCATWLCSSVMMRETWWVAKKGTTLEDKCEKLEETRKFIRKAKLTGLAKNNATSASKLHLDDQAWKMRKRVV